MAPNSAVYVLTYLNNEPVECCSLLMGVGCLVVLSRRFSSKHWWISRFTNAILTVRFRNNFDATIAYTTCRLRNYRRPSHSPTNARTFRTNAMAIPYAIVLFPVPRLFDPIVNQPVQFEISRYFSQASVRECTQIIERTAGVMAV